MAFKTIAYPISVVVPTYNRAHFLEKTLKSVLNQSVQCEEIIVVNDGSEDNTVEIVKKISHGTNLPIHLLNQKNLGPAAARNRGIIAANCDFVAFLDSDDHWHKKKIEYQFKHLQKNKQYYICHTQEKWLRNGQHLNQKKIHLPRQGDIFDHCLHLCAVGMSTVMVKKELFELEGLFDESFRCCEDYDYWLRISSKYPFLLLGKRLTTKEGGRKDQVSVQYRQGMDKFRIQSIIKLLDSRRLNNAQIRFAIQELGKKCAVYGNGCIKHGKIKEGEHYLLIHQKYKTKYIDRM